MIRAAELAIEVTASSPESAEAQVFLDPDFAGFAGHFPGEPVLPAMCQIDFALRTASRALGGPLDLVGVQRARFSRKALPGETLTIRIARRADGRLDVILRVGAEPCAEFVLEVSRRPAAG